MTSPEHYAWKWKGYNGNPENEPLSCGCDETDCYECMDAVAHDYDMTHAFHAEGETYKAYYGEEWQPELGEYFAWLIEEMGITTTQQYERWAEGKSY